MKPEKEQTSAGKWRMRINGLEFTGTPRELLGVLREKAFDAPSLGSTADYMRHLLLMVWRTKHIYIDIGKEADTPEETRIRRLLKGLAASELIELEENPHED